MENNDKLKYSIKSKIAVSKFKEEYTAKKNHFINKKVIAIACAFILLTSSVVYANNVIDYIKSLFINSTQSIDKAVENNYIQNINMKYIYDNNIGVKVDYLLIDDNNFDVSFSYKSNDNNIKLIRINNYIISNENGDIIYDSEHTKKDKINLANSIIRHNDTIKVDNKTYKESILFGLINEKKQFKNLFFNITNLTITYNDNNIYDLDGNWDFEILLDEKMINSTNVLYSFSENEYIESASAVMSNTGFIIKLKLNISINPDILRSSTHYGILKNNSNEEFIPNTVTLEDINNITLNYNNIGKNTPNIDILKLYLNINQNDSIILTLKK